MIRGAALAFAGGCVGGALRLGVGALWEDGPGVPWSLVVINLIGSLAIGIASVRGRDNTWWPLVGPGLLGGFTTFSGVAAVAWSPDADSAAILAALVVSVVLCTAAAAAGRGLAERAVRGRP